MLTIRSKVVPFSFSVSTTLCFKSCSHFLWTLQETRHLVMGQQVNWTSSELGIMWPTEPQKRMSNKYKLISAYASLGQSRSENTSKVHGLGTQTILVLSPLLYLPSLSSHLQSHGGGGVPYDQPRVQGTCQGLIYREISMICQHQLAVVSCNSTISHRDGLWDLSGIKKHS